MKLTLNLSPVRSDKETTATVNGAVLTVNGTAYDLSELPDGAVAQHPEIGEVTRNGDDYECTIKLGHPSQSWQPKDDDLTVMTRASEAMRFPEPIIVTTDGGVPLPQPEVWNMTEDHDVEKIKGLAQ